MSTTRRDKVIRELFVEYLKDPQDAELLLAAAFDAGAAAERARQRDYYDRIAGVCAEGQRNMNPEKYKP